MTMTRRTFPLVTVPEGESGRHRIERFTVGAADAQFEMMRAMFSSSRGRGVPEGTYTRLMRGGTLVMSDTPDECWDHRPFYQFARGHVLINGLGLGMVLQAVLLKDGVERATVVEKSPDVIALVGPHYEEMFPGRVEIVEADALEWNPPKGVRYGAAWHDIWDAMCEDNLPQMHRLHRKYGRRTDWQGSWGRGIIETRRRQESRDRRGWGGWW